jgi:hypothetical protein
MKRTFLSGLFAAAAALSLGGCGGHSASPAPASASTADPLSAVPGSASQSVDGMVGYLAALATLDADAREPVDASRFNPPVPEDSEPAPAPPMR